MGRRGTTTLCLMAMLAVSHAGAGYVYNRPTGQAFLYPSSYASPSRVAQAHNTLTVLAEQPYTVDKAMATVPLVVIPQDHLRVLQHARIAAISPTRPVVTLQAPTLPNEQEATPAVRVVLQRPMYVNALESTIPFPAGFTIVHEGLRMPIPVGAVYAPVPTGAYHLGAGRPFAIHVVYAVPTGPLPIQYPYYPHHGYPSLSGPLYVNPGTGTIQTVRPVQPIRPIQPIRPVQPIQRPDAPVQSGDSKPPSSTSGQVSSGRPVVTVLDFPSEVASPPVLFFQPPTLDSEAGGGNPEPPQAVVPAGIVQSTAPGHVQSVFINSKESDYLQTLRDEAERRQQQQNQQLSLSDINNIIEVLYN